MNRIVLAVLLLLSYPALADDAPPQVVILDDVPEDMPRVAEVHALTHGPKHHFFGYYGISPWNPAGTHLVCFETEFSDRLPEAEDRAGICLIDLATGEMKRIAETATWNFQQGALMHWMSDDAVIYNDAVDGEMSAVVLNVKTGEKRTLPRPLAAVARNGKYLASINYARLRDTRPGYGYAGQADPWAEEMHPKADGLYIVDTATGESKLIVSIDQVYHAQDVPEPLRDAKMWFNHVIFSRDDQRLFFLGRFRGATKSLVSAAFTVGIDGSDLRCVIPYEWNASHFDWVDGERIVLTTRYDGGSKWRHVLFTDGKDDYEVLAPDAFAHDGHCHFGPKSEWMVTDSYPRGKARYRSFYLYHHPTQRVAELARFHEPKEFRGDWRCDLHPRWHKDGQRISIDSSHDGTRQVYVVELEN